MEPANAIQRLMNEGLVNCKVTVADGGPMLHPSEVSEDELQRRRADLKAFLYDVAQSSTSRAQAVEKMVLGSLPAQIVALILPEEEFDRHRFLSDETTVIELVAGLIDAEVEVQPVTIAIHTLGHKGPKFGVAADGSIMLYLTETTDESMMAAYQAVLRIDTALEGLIDMHCPQCGKRLGMQPRLCKECATQAGGNDD